MKVLFVETSLEGHRTVYLKNLCGGNFESVALLPEKCGELSCRQFVYEKTDYCVSRSFGSYRSWINEIKEVAEKENCDVIHFLCGDYLYRYFGCGLKKLKQKTVVTFHHMAFDTPKRISVKRIFAGIDTGIVHTESLLERLKALGISNAAQIEYPCFNSIDAGSEQISAADAKKALGIPENAVCLTVLGTLNSYKGIELLLQALDAVKQEFVLCIAGYPRDITEEKIREATANYADRTVLMLHRLSEDEYIKTVIASDILVLPYLRSFDGASGPLTDAVWHRKPVIGADHGSMGDIIRRRELGLTFASENVDALTEALNKALENGLGWTDKAETFRKMLDPGEFVRANEKLYGE